MEDHYQIMEILLYKPTLVCLHLFIIELLYLFFPALHYAPIPLPVVLILTAATDVCLIKLGKGILQPLND